MKKFGKKLAGKKFRQAKIWREHGIRSENESKPENLGSKMGPESEILRNSLEFRSDFPTKAPSPRRPKSCPNMMSTRGALSKIYQRIAEVSAH